MLSTAFLLAALAGTLVVATDYTNHLNLRCDGSTINCRSHSEIAKMISDLKEENRQLRLEVDPNCTICWSNPCLNNGVCVPLSRTDYRCDCPDDYGGRLCDKKIECTSKSCGKNAKCYVANHQVNCVCNYGYSGNPKYGCSVKTVESCMEGDPHYKTFDGQRYEYQGTCPYIFSQPCNYLSTEQYSYFSVKAKNELSYARAHVSTVSEVEVEMYGQRIHVDSLYRLFVNGEKKFMPYYYPSKSNPKITVKISWFKVVISNDQFVKVTFGFDQLCVQIPDTPDLEGPDVLCGLAGNVDSNCKNDFRFRNGTVMSVSKCDNRNQHYTEPFGDSWITDDFMPLTSGPTPVCLTGDEVDNETLTCDLAAIKAKCASILDATSGGGIFGACMELGADTIQNAYDNCVFDGCRDPNMICSSMTTFVRICQVALPNTPLDWRQAAGCPALSCGLHMVPKPCANGCPATCTNTNVTTECAEGCLEGCDCDVGYVLDFSDARNPKCIKIEDCGCVDTDGNAHGPTDVWLNTNCTQKDWCANGTFHFIGISCSKDGYCGVGGNFERKCICNKGFVGDGYDCKDIDECSDPTMCGADKGHGICTNTPGSYQCQCLGYYSGSNCDSYLPMRHCADLRIFHGKTADGVYTIKPPYPYNGLPAETPLEVYCDMTTDGGGWTMMSNSLTDSMSNKTLEQYRLGFGNPTIKDLWIGLEVIYGMTNDILTSLRLNLHRCSHNGKPNVRTYCVYPRFTILDQAGQFAVVIPEECLGSESSYFDGWARWDLSGVGPIFLAYDADNSAAKCSETYRNTGWWFDTTARCGAANLNGNRYSCDNVPDEDSLQHYLHWNGDPLSEVELYLRPMAFPNYDTAH